MAFVAEDGTGKADANSLCDVAFADAYFLDRAVVAWAAATNDGKQAALVKATDYIETRWVNRFRGCVQFPDTPQALSFPRTGIGSDDAVPDRVKKACAEYALRALAGKDLAPDPTVDATGRAVQSTRRKVGPIETETVYSQGTSVQQFKPYPAADTLLRPYLLPGGGLTRA